MSVRPWGYHLQALSLRAQALTGMGPSIWTSGDTLSCLGLLKVTK